MDSSRFFELSERISDEIIYSLSHLDDWGKADGHSGQYKHDVIADEIATPQLLSLIHISEPTRPRGIEFYGLGL